MLLIPVFCFGQRDDYYVTRQYTLHYSGSVTSKVQPQIDSKPVNDTIYTKAKDSLFFKSTEDTVYYRMHNETKGEAISDSCMGIRHTDWHCKIVGRTRDTVCTEWYTYYKYFVRTLKGKWKRN